MQNLLRNIHSTTTEDGYNTNRKLIDKPVAYIDIGR